MTAGNYNIEEITKAIYQAMSGVSANIFTSRPDTVPTAMSDFVVVSLPTRVNDRLALGDTICRISLFAKNNIVNNIPYENILKLQTMQDAVYAKLPIKTSKYMIERPVVFKGGSDKLGFHILHIQLDVTIL